jgi:hypothetical protein
MTEPDLLYGADAIAGYVSSLLSQPIDRKKLYRWAADGRLSVGRLGKNMIASKAKLHAELNDCATGPASI